MKDNQRQNESSNAATKEMSRRRFLGFSLGATAAGSVFGLTGYSGRSWASAEGPIAVSSADLSGINQFTIANWGGITSDAMMSSWARLFTNRTGIKVNAVPFDYGKFVAQIKNNNVTWDWADVEGWFPIANSDLLQEIPYNKVGVSATDMIDPALFTPKAVGSYLNSYVIAYRGDAKGQHPRTWEQFFDTKGIPGKRSIYNWPYGMVEIALLADGVPFDDLYPLDLDRAFNKIDSIRDHLVFWNTGAEAQQYIVSGAADFIVAWSSRVSYLALGGLPVEVEWGQNLRIADFHVIPRNDPRKPACVEFITAALDPQAQATFAVKAGGLSPTTKKGLELVDDYVKPHLNTYPENWEKAIGSINDEWWATNLNDTSTKWFEFVGG